MRIRKVVAATLALGLGLGASLLVALPAAAEPIIGFTDPGNILTTDTVLNLEGITETEISSITITFADSESVPCSFDQPDAESWECAYSAPDGLAEGDAQLHFEFVDPYSAPEDETFTVHAPPAPDVSLNEHGRFYETTTSIILGGGTNYTLSGVDITFADGEPVPCELTEATPSDWSCTYSNPDGLPVGEAFLDFSFVDADPLLDDESFTVDPAITISGPDTIDTAESSVQFSGTTVVPVSPATIYFADGSSTACEVVQEAADWDCTGYPEEHLPAEPTFPVGPAYLEVTLDGFSTVHRFDFTVVDYSAVPYLEEPTFAYGDPGQVSTSTGLTGGATSGDLTLYSWDTYYGPESIDPCGEEDGREQCNLDAQPSPIALDVDAGSWEIRTTQDWGDSDAYPTTKSYNFRIPDAPTAEAFAQADGSVTFEGYGTPTDLITVTDGEGNEICSTEVEPSDPDDSDGYWQCESDGSRDLAGVQLFVGAQDQGFGEAHAEDFADEFELDSTYVPGGRSALTDVNVPHVSYHFTPGALTVTATPTLPATVAGVQVYVPDDGDFEGYYGGGCPNSPDYPASDGENDFPDIDPGTLVCAIELQPGPWAVVSYEDDGHGLTAAEYYLDDRYFFIPSAPVIANVSGTVLNQVVISGSVGDDDNRGWPGDIVHVYGGASTLCSAVVDESGDWSCTTATLPGGTYPIRAAVENRTAGCDCSYPDPYYLAGGLSDLNDDAFSITLPDLPTPPSGGTTPSGPTTPPAPTTLSWSFDVKGLDLSHVHPGDKFTITGAGLPAGSVITIELHSTPITLGTVTVAPDGTFSLSGTIPNSVEPGEHHLVATLTAPGLAPATADKAITIEGTTSAFSSSEGTATAEGNTETDAHSAEAEHASTAPNILTDSLNPIAEVFTDPGRVPAAFAAGLVLLLFAIMPAHLLNATLGEQYERFARKAPRLRTQPGWYKALKAALTKAPVLGGVAITAVVGFLFAFADPSFGFNLHSLRLILALGAALFVVTYLANAITALIMRRAWAVDVVVSIRPLGLVLTVVGVILSRILDFSPGFLIGLVLGLSIASHSAAKSAWKAVLIRTSVLIVFGVAAWITYSSIAPGVHHEPTFWNELVLEFFVAVATEGIVMMLIEMLPFHLLEGERLYRRSRALWGALYLLLLVVFILAVVPWEGNWRELGESFWPWFTVVAIFGVVCVSIYLYFRFVAPHDEEEHDHDASLEDAHERIAVGDD